MENSVVKINDYDLPIKMYEGKRVVTFKDIDACHHRPEGTARKRFNDNKKRFIESVDYFVRKTDEALNEFGIIAPNGLILITHTGYLMLVKSFTDDLSWQVQRDLVNKYFAYNELSKKVEKLNSLASMINDLVKDNIDNIICKAVNDIKQEFTDILNNFTYTPSQSNYWLWKKHVVNPIVGKISQKLKINSNDVYTLIYDNMAAQYGFYKPYAINQFCAKYNVESVSCIDAVADDSNYMFEFWQSAIKLLECCGVSETEQSNFIDSIDDTIPEISTVNQNPATQNTKVKDEIEKIIEPLIIKCGDKSPHGVVTLRKIYREMKSDRSWKSLMTRRHIHNKKKLVLSDPKLLSELNKTVQSLLCGN